MTKDFFEIRSVIQYDMGLIQEMDFHFYVSFLIILQVLLPVRWMICNNFRHRRSRGFLYKFINGTRGTLFVIWLRRDTAKSDLELNRHASRTINDTIVADFDQRQYMTITLSRSSSIFWRVTVITMCYESTFVINVAITYGHIQYRRPKSWKN